MILSLNIGFILDWIRQTLTVFDIYINVILNSWKRTKKFKGEIVFRLDLGYFKNIFTKNS